jgi:hypothetical protein
MRNLTPTINPEIKAQWVADLRANPDAQGKQRLTTIYEGEVEKDCCWGRLCKLLPEEVAPRRRRYWPSIEISDEDAVGVVDYANNTGLPGRRIFKYIGINTADEPELRTEDNFYSPDKRGVVGSSTVAPIPVSQWYGWDSCNPDLYDEEGNQASAVGLNDDFGFDFKAIAAAFRRTYVTTEAIAEVAASAK